MPTAAASKSHFPAPPTAKKLTRQQLPHGRHQLTTIGLIHVEASFAKWNSKQIPS
jgi:hypothetical protein